MWSLVFIGHLLMAAASGPTLHTTVQADAAPAQGRVGVACALQGAPLDCGLNADAMLPMQSVYKLPIAMAMLDAVEHGRFALQDKIRFLPSDLAPHSHSPLQDAHPHANVDVPLEELMRLAVTESDNVASDMLLRVLGGPGVADAYLRRLGIANIHIKDTERALHSDVRLQYRNDASPTALVNLLEKLAAGSALSPQHTALVTGWMTESDTGVHRIKGMLPAGTVVAHKTGTSDTDAGITHATNDAGWIVLPDGRKLFVAVMVIDSPASETVREGVIAKIARDVWLAADPHPAHAR
jgi:beta-lactamase class A